MKKNGKKCKHYFDAGGYESKPGYSRLVQYCGRCGKAFYSKWVSNNLVNDKNK